MPSTSGKSVVSIKACQTYTFSRHVYASPKSLHIRLLRSFAAATNLHLPPAHCSCELAGGKGGKEISNWSSRMSGHDYPRKSKASAQLKQKEDRAVRTSTLTILESQFESRVVNTLTLYP